MPADLRQDSSSLLPWITPSPCFIGDFLRRSRPLNSSTWHHQLTLRPKNFSKYQPHLRSLRCSEAANHCSGRRSGNANQMAHGRSQYDSGYDCWVVQNLSETAIHYSDEDGYSDEFHALDSPKEIRSVLPQNHIQDGSRRLLSAIGCMCFRG